MSIQFLSQFLGESILRKVLFYLVIFYLVIEQIFEGLHFHATHRRQASVKVRKEGMGDTEKGPKERALVRGFQVLN